MELSTARGISNLPSMQPKPLAPIEIQSFNCRTRFPFMLKQIRFDSRAKTGLRCRINSSLRSTASEETSAERRPYDAGDSEAVGDVIVEKTNNGEKKEYYDNQPGEAPQEVSLIDNLQFLKFLEEFDIKSHKSAALCQLDYEDTYSVLVFGGGAAISLWLAAAVVGAIDSIPLIPKVLELIGLGYTIWFSSRYLIFKENRDELIARVEQIKQQVFGSKD